MSQKQWGKLFGSFRNREPGRMIRVSATRSMTKKNCRERTWPAWLPDESLETQFSARNNYGFGSDGYLVVGGQRHRRQYKQEGECSNSQQLSLDVVIGVAATL